MGLISLCKHFAAQFLKIDLTNQHIPTRGRREQHIDEYVTNSILTEFPKILYELRKHI